jgi:hypothetical protein
LIREKIKLDPEHEDHGDTFELYGRQE